MKPLKLSGTQEQVDRAQLLVRDLLNERDPQFTNSAQPYTLALDGMITSDRMQAPGAGGQNPYGGTFQLFGPGAFPGLFLLAVLLALVWSFGFGG